MVALALSPRAVRVRSSLPAEVEAGVKEVSGGLERVIEEIRVFSQGLQGSRP
jgi:hypothetical protein